ncbi:MAG TPA: PAS domain S-box protein [Acidobacteriota bacterium]|nr:PAS domain S-box protein [Acidobacteriota bacterium]
MASLVEGDDGVLWALADRGLVYYDDFVWKAVEGLGPKSGNLPRSIAPAAGSGVLLVQDGQLFRVDRSGAEYLEILYGDAALDVLSAAALPSNRILIAGREGFFLLEEGSLSPVGALPGGEPGRRLAVRSHSGRVWALAQEGLFQLQGHEWRKVISRPVCAVTDDLSGDRTLAMGCSQGQIWTWTRMDRSPRRLETEDRIPLAVDVSPRGEIFVSYNDGGLGIFDGQAWSRIDPAPDDLVNPRFMTFQRSGNLWIGSPQGLSLCRLSSDRWTNWMDEAPEYDGNINALLVDGQGNTWIGGSRGLAVQRSTGRAEAFQEALGRRLGSVTALAEDSRGGIWVGSGSAFSGAFRYSQAGWDHFGPQQGLAAPRVHRIVPDQRGALWFLGLGSTIGDDDPGAFRWDGSRFTRWDKEAGLVDNRVYAFAEGPDGAFWFATGGGISRFLGGAWRHWTARDGLRSSSVFTLTVTARGRVWFGHRQALGLGYLDQQGRPRYLGSGQGLVDDRVWEVAEDGDGALWIATEGGLSRLKEGQFSNFAKSHGLLNPHIWPLLPLQDRLLMGTRNGVVTLSLTEASSPAPRVFLAEPVLSSEKFFFRWMAFSYRGEMPAASIQTRYRLDGGQWSQWSLLREVEFSALSAGSHSLEVQSKSLFGNLSDADMASLSFNVAPPFYRHPLVLMLAAVWIFSLAGLALHHHRMVMRREEHFRSLIENAQESITILDQEGRIQYQSPAVKPLLGLSAEGLTGTSYFDLLHPEDVKEVRSRLAPVWQTLAPLHTLKARFRHHDGSWRWLEASVHSIEVDEKQPHLVINAVDVTARDQAEKALRNEKERFRRLFDGALTGNFVIDRQGRILACNPAFARLFGFSSVEDSQRRNFFDLMEDRRGKSRFIRPLKEEGEVRERILRMVHQDGHILDVLTSAFAVRDAEGGIVEIQGHMLDDSERREIELQLLQAQKMESIGALAGGIAHDFNNLISVINGYSDMVLTKLDADTPFREFVEQIKKAGDRASLLTNQILAFSRRQVLQSQLIDLNVTLEDIGSLIRRLIGENIELSTRFSDQAGCIKIDAGQLEQIVMNLVVNARDAMPGGGRLTLQSSRTPLERARAEALGIEPGEYAQLTVSDTGIGMDEATQQRIFEPFFTTKELEKGTGLGLSTVYAIVRQNGGAIYLESVLGKGTTFTVLLPRVRSSEHPSPQKERAQEPPGTDHIRKVTDLHPAQNGTVSRNGRSPTVLLVEDDTAVRDLSGQILLAGGYRVLTAKDGHHAIKVSQDFQEPIDLLVTDVIMPGMNGYELGRRLSRHRVGVKVLYLSGYTDDVLDQLDPHKPGINFMQKPFTPDALLQKVSKLLSA